MSACILGIGTARPARQLQQDDAAQMAAERCADTDRQRRVTPGLYRMTSVQRRASALLEPSAAGEIDAHSFDWFYTPRNGSAGHGDADADNGTGDAPRGPTTGERMRRFLELAPPLAHDAGAAALADAGVDAASITHLVVVTCSGFGSPGVEFRLIESLGLRRDVSRTQVGFMGCHGAFNGLRVAKAFAEAEADARVLMVCVELCSLHFQYGWHAERVVANALFADGAAALVIGDTETNGPGAAGWTVDHLTSAWLPDTEDQMSWHVGDHGFEMTLASTVPAAIGARVRGWCESWLGERGLGMGDVGGWAIHPGGPRIVTAVGEALGLDDGQVELSRSVLRECGNMSSATIGFILERMIGPGVAPRSGGPDGPIVALSFGPGLAAEAALLGGPTMRP